MRWRLSASSRQRRWYKLLAESGLFDREYYVRQCRQVGRGDPISHYLERGAATAIDPHPLFHTRFYLESHPEVEATGECPLVHFIVEGAKRGFDPCPHFNTRFYVERYPDVAAASVNPLAHYLRAGAAERRYPCAAFDSGYYLDTYPDVVGSGFNPLVHYVLHGWRERRRPSAAFDPDLYLLLNPDACGQDPLIHLARALQREATVATWVVPAHQSSGGGAPSERPFTCFPPIAGGGELLPGERVQ